MKKVLIISYYWPPSGGPGVQRVLKFVKYLPEFGWEPVILTVKNGNYPSVDETLLADIPPGCRVYKTDIFEPFNIYKSITGKTGKEKIPTFVLNESENEKLTEKISKWIRANLFIPDAKSGWIKYIYNEGLKIIEKENPDLIFSSSPPHSLQVGAGKLAKKTGIKWVADFRDPWSGAFWQADLKRRKQAEKKDKNYEKSVLSSSNAVTTVSKSIVEMFRGISPNNYFVLPNGFDESDFKFVKSKNVKFTISYIGTLGKDQPVESLLVSLNRIPENYRERIKVEFYGSFHESIKTAVAKNGMEKFVSFNDPVPHSEAVKVVQQSDLLLLVIPNTPGNEGILTGKLFEYLASGNSVLGIGPANGDASEILNQTGCGKMFDFGSDMSSFISGKISDWEHNISPEINKDEVKKYSRKALTEKLVSVFEETL